MLLECSVDFKGITVAGETYMRREDGLFEVNDPSHAQILLQSPKWTTSPKATFKEVKEPRKSKPPEPKDEKPADSKDEE